ncbi:MAG: hypothetical protein U1D69_02840, partial [Polynucleobacter sp.]|nr:hypothetical protein [Polynucleobacter sp.]
MNLSGWLISIFWSKVPEQRHLAVSILLGVCVCLTMIPQLTLGIKILHESLAPNGIVSFELAGTQDQAQKIANAWHQRGVFEVARQSIYWDFLFLLAYGLCLSFLCFIATSAWSGLSPGRRTGIVLSWGVLIASGLDALENVAMLFMLAEQFIGPAAMLAKAFAINKFILLIVAGVYLLVSFALSLYRVLVAKMIFTLILWVAPLLLIPPDWLDRAGFTTIHPPLFSQLLGLSYLSLIACYGSGVSEIRKNVFPRTSVFVGIVSNGLAAYCLALYLGFEGHEVLSPL